MQLMSTKLQKSLRLVLKDKQFQQLRTLLLSVIQIVIRTVQGYSFVVYNWGAKD